MRLCLFFSGPRNQALIVAEGDNVKLQCAAHGTPRPVINWIRTSGAAIPIGPWHGKVFEKKI